MKPAGIILTYMSRQDWKGKSFWIKVRTIFFNAILFVFQLVFMVVGTVIGKIKWPEYYDWRGLVPLWSLAILVWFIPKWTAILVAIVMIFIAVAILRHIDWRKVWRAAQCSHVRLCLKKVCSIRPINVTQDLFKWQYINFGYPKAKMQYWFISQCDGKRFEYRDPTFEPSDEFIAAMIQYAEDQVGKPYDDYQLASPMVNFPIWICYPPWWGQEKIGWANRPGGLEFCSSGVTACLRWGHWKSMLPRIRTVATKFFKGYDTAMVLPCLFVIDEKWRKKE